MREASFSKFVSEVQRHESSTRRVPPAGKREFEFEADDAVIVVLDLSGKALAGFEDQRLERFVYGRTLVADVCRGLLEAGFGGARGEEFAELVEADLFADVVLDEDEDGAVEGFCRM